MLINISFAGRRARFENGYWNGKEFSIRWRKLMDMAQIMEST